MESRQALSESGTEGALVAGAGGLMRLACQLRRAVWCFAGKCRGQKLGALSARKLGHLGASPSALPAMQRAEWRA